MTLKKGGGGASSCYLQLFTLLKSSHAKHGQSFKKRFGSMTGYLCGKKNLPSGVVQVSESFFNHGSC